MSEIILSPHLEETEDIENTSQHVWGENEGEIGLHITASVEPHEYAMNELSMSNPLVEEGNLQLSPVIDLYRLLCSFMFRNAEELRIQLEEAENAIVERDEALRMLEKQIENNNTAIDILENRIKVMQLEVSGDMIMMEQLPLVWIFILIIFILIIYSLDWSKSRENRFTYWRKGYINHISPIAIRKPQSWDVQTSTSAIIIVGALATSLIIYDIIDKLNIAKRYRAPFSLLSGWLSIATIVNISKALRNLGFTSIFGINQIGWTNILLVLGAVLAILFTILRNDILYPLTFVWGYIGILVEHKDIKSILYTSIAMIVVIVAGVIYDKIRRRKLVSR